MNDVSSRSHSVLQIFITYININDHSIKKSKLFLVDLAGSEGASKTGVIGKRFEELKNINTSLLTLGTVINYLSKNKNTHIP